MEHFPSLHPLFQVLLGVCLLLGIVAAAAFRNLRIKRQNKNVPSDPAYVLQFPPPRRYDVRESLTALEKCGLELEVDPSTLWNKALPTTRAQDLEKDNQFTPTGFSTQQIRALGRFPDYSVLSGVRYPEPYGAHFDISKARFRPFRPFRWNYHQTMCTSISLGLMDISND
jgi:hypothetical protein